jgi:hypothetical protein
MKKIISVISVLFFIGSHLATASSTIPFDQNMKSGGFEAGAYDLKADQPTVDNWTHQSAYNMPDKPVELWRYADSFGIGSSLISGVDHDAIFNMTLGAIRSVTQFGLHGWVNSGDSGHSSAILGVTTLPTACTKNIVYTNSRDDKALYGYVPSKGYIVYSARMTPSVVAGAVITKENNQITADLLGNVSFFKYDGETLWTTKINGSVVTSPVIGKNGLIYVVTLKSNNGQGNVYALDKDGVVKWNYMIPSDTENSPIIDAQGNLLIASSDGILRSVTKDGVLNWSLLLGGSNLSSPSLSSNGTIYVHEAGMKLHAISLLGKELWSIQTHKSATKFAYNPAPIIDGKGLILTSNNKTNSITVVNTNGTIKSQNIVGISPLITSNGILYTVYKNALIAYTNGTVNRPGAEKGPTASDAIPFKDVNNKYWAFNEIQWAFYHGIIQGYSEKVFDPNRNISEAEFLAILLNAYKPAELLSNNDYIMDANIEGETNWYDRFYYALKTYGWGIKQLKNEPITRGYMAQLITNALGKDFKTEDEAIQFMLDNHLANGKYSATVEGYGKNDNLKRSEIVAFVYRLMEVTHSLKKLGDLQ